MNNNEKLILKNQYEGGRAINYDNAREQSSRHKAEEAIIGDYIMQVQPKQILDCPCGTMRWIDIYAASGASVLGVDLSEDMIAQAKMKVIEKELNEKISFLQGNIINNATVLENDKLFDMVLCVRFLNWIPTENALEVITSLSKYSNSFFLVGCTVLPQKWSLLDKIKAKYILYKDNKNRIKNNSAKRYVHNEKKFEQFLKTIDYNVVEKKITMKNKDAENYLYLLSKK